MSWSTPFLRRNSPTGLGGGDHRKCAAFLCRRSLRLCSIEVFLLALASVVFISFFMINNLCFDESCRLPLFSSLKSKPVTPALISLTQPLDEGTADYFQTQFDIDRILVRYFGLDLKAYEKQKQSQQNSMIDFYQIHFKQTPKFNISGRDVAVFLHMQKTGGSAFGRHLIRDLRLSRPCECDEHKRKKCPCLRPGSSKEFWLFSRYSIGWRCGLHADYTELTNCVDRVLNSNEPSTSPRRYFYLTLLRDPVSRFLSEFKHVQRGATWKASRHWCNGRLPTSNELRSCYAPRKNWRNVSLEEFMACPDNLAINRQTRMLADLSLVNCYNRTLMTPAERDIVMLYSAKQTLKRMAFVGLCEEQLASQYVFQQTMGLTFKRAFVQFNQTISSQAANTLAPAVLDKIRKLNMLDMKLYAYAKRLFRARFVAIKEADNNFETNFAGLVEMSKKEKKTASKHENNAKVVSTSSTSHPANHLADEDGGDYDLDGGQLYENSNEVDSVYYY